MLTGNAVLKALDDVSVEVNAHTLGSVYREAEGTVTAEINTVSLDADNAEICDPMGSVHDRNETAFVLNAQMHNQTKSANY